jgi:putative acetyltransferase
MDKPLIRPECRQDRTAIAEVIRAAFLDQPHSQQNEHRIVDQLRNKGALSLSLVATVPRGVVGHIAFSPVTLSPVNARWFALGPLAVLPSMQWRGIGATLVQAGLAALRAQGESGCVVFGDPDFYRRFGFSNFKGLTAAGLPSAYFRRRFVISHPHLPGRTRLRDVRLLTKPVRKASSPADRTRVRRPKP